MNIVGTLPARTCQNIARTCQSLTDDIDDDDDIINDHDSCQLIDNAVTFIFIMPDDNIEHDDDNMMTMMTT